jgi:CARDB
VNSCPTPGLPAGTSTRVQATIPPGCFDPDCGFTIVVDATDQLKESNERNDSRSTTILG